MASSPSVGITGLGLLGSALALKLKESGFNVTGFDIDPDSTNQFQEHEGTSVESIDKLLKINRRIIFSLPNSNISQEVVQQILSSSNQPEIIIDTTTGEPDQMKTIGELCKQKGIQYLDATVGGSSAQVRTKEIILMIGGEELAVNACQDLWDCWSHNYYHVGPSGSGAKMKLVMNLILGLNRAVLAEGLSLAKSMNLPAETTLEILKASPAFSQVMQTKGMKMIEADFEPQARLAQHLKDVRLILEKAKENNQKTPLSSLHESILDKLCKEGLGNLDNSSVIKYFESN